MALEVEGFEVVVCFKEGVDLGVEGFQSSTMLPIRREHRFGQWLQRRPEACGKCLLMARCLRLEQHLVESWKKKHMWYKYTILGRRGGEGRGGGTHPMKSDILILCSEFSSCHPLEKNDGSALQSISVISLDSFC